MLPLRTTFLPSGRCKIATASPLLAVLNVISALVFHVHSTLCDIEQFVPLKILEQRQDIAELKQQIGELRELVDDAEASRSVLQAVLDQVARKDDRLRQIRSTDAHSEVANLADAADRLAVEALEDESRKITLVRNQMIAVFAILFLAVIALVYYVTRINTAQGDLD